jgi:uncharacterized membrane protein YidH (DUF202 family)
VQVTHRQKRNFKLKTIGIVLLVIGVLALVYGGISYNKNHTVLQVGSLNVTATEHKSIPVPAVAGVVVLVGGVAFLVLGMRRSQPA